MKRNTYAALIGLNLITLPAFSQMKEPSYPLSKKAKIALLGAADAARLKGDFTCSGLLSKTWAYPNAAVLSLCYDAERSCYAYLILRDQAQQAKTKTKETNNSILSAAHSDAQFRLSSCILAIENSGLQGETQNIPSFGPYTSPFQDLTPAPSPPTNRPPITLPRN